MARAEIRADISGTVIEIACKVGDHIAEGDDLFILDSMKMEVPLPATCAGWIVEIHSAVGDVVEGGHLLAVVEIRA